MSKKGTVEVVKTELQIEEDIRLQEKGWRFQRWGWAFIFSMVILAALGLFGDGIISKRTEKIGGAEVEYERFYRHDAPMEINVERASGDTAQTQIAFPNHYLKNFRIESILPQPKENQVFADKTYFLFNGQGAMHVVFYFVPKKVGNISGSIDVNNQPFSLHHFIFP